MAESILVAAAGAVGTALSGVVLVAARRRWAMADRRLRTEDDLRDECQRYRNGYYRATEYARRLLQDAITLRELYRRDIPGWEALLERMADDNLPEFLDEPEPPVLVAPESWRLMDDTSDPERKRRAKLDNELV